MVFLCEDDRLHHRALFKELLTIAHDKGILGATVWRGIEGFGPGGHVRTSRFPDATTGLPVVIELVDNDDRVDGFLESVHELAPGSLVTREQIRVIRTRNTPDT
jgi:hypothetical protein